MENFAEALTRIETKLDVAIARLEDHETRLRALESKSGRRWETIVTDVIKILVAAAMGYFIAGGKV